MDGIAPIGGGGYLTSRPMNLQSAQAPAAPAADAPNASNLKGGGALAPDALAASGSQALSLSSTSMAMESQSLSMQSAPAANNNELLGAVLLMLMLEYLTTQDENKKDALLGAMVGLAALQSMQQDQGASLSYSSMSMSMESTQIQMVSSESVAGAYGAVADNTKVPLGDAASGSEINTYA